MREAGGQDEGSMREARGKHEESMRRTPRSRRGRENAKLTEVGHHVQGEPKPPVLRLVPRLLKDGGVIPEEPVDREVSGSEEGAHPLHPAPGRVGIAGGLRSAVAAVV